MSDKVYRLLGAALIAFVCVFFIVTRHIEKMKAIECDTPAKEEKNK